MNVLGDLNIQPDFPERTYNKLLGTSLRELSPTVWNARRSLNRVRTTSNPSAPKRRGRFARRRRRRTTPQWTTPEVRFMRIAYHLYARARRLSYDVRSVEFYSPERFGMPPAADYAATLATDAGTLVATSFRQICDQSTPFDFKQIYERDQRTWISAQQPSKRNAWPAVERRPVFLIALPLIDNN
ncbi:hypothetical protein [Novipirellula galeiformis]|uniref:hypothetical protein n=1 Tax=Novipirellula galeiformis TaxID=2528004 RepID=UPI0011B6A8C6|nr:hypothetical protein [Novipirellula galeiformis]